MSTDHPGLAARLDAVSSVAASLQSTGLALADPDLAGELRELAADLAASGLVSGAERLVALSERLNAVARETGPDRRGAARATYDAMQAVATWLRTWRAALALEVARERLGGAPPVPLPPPARAPLESRTVSVLGVEESGSRVRFHAADTNTGEHVVLEEPRPPGVVLALDRPFPSQLLQADVPLRTLLDATLSVGGLPAGRKRGRVEIHPSFSRAAQLRKRRLVPPLGRAAQRGLANMDLVARSGPDGWTLETTDGEVLDIAVDQGLALDLVKRSADEPAPRLSAVVVRTSDATLLLRLEEADGPSWPWLDPTTHRWPAELEARLVRHGEATETVPDSPWLEIAARAEAMPAPEGLAFLEAHVALLRTQIEKGDPVPSGHVLSSVGRMLARLRGEPPGAPPIAALELPVGRLRLAAAAPIARFLAGSGDARAAADGLLLAVASGVAGDLFER